MSNQKSVIEVIKQLSGQANVLTIPRLFIDLTGDIEAALFLSQCIYWSDKTGRADGFFYKTYEEWGKETTLTRRALDRARKITGAYVETKILRANSAPTLHYKVDFDALYSILAARFVQNVQNENEPNETPPFVQNVQIGFDQNVQIDLPETYKSLTETTTEITTEIKEDQRAGARTPTPHYLIAEALAEVTGMDLRKNPRIFREAKLYQPGDEQQIRANYGKGKTPWYLNDWRGKKGERPSLSQIRETWGSYGPAKPAGDLAAEIAARGAAMREKIRAAREAAKNGAYQSAA